MLKQLFSPPYMYAQISFRKLSIFQCWIIGNLAGYYFHSSAGTFLAGPSVAVSHLGKLSLHTWTLGSGAIPLKLYFLDSHFCSGRSEVLLLMDYLEGMEATVLCRLWSTLLSLGTWNSPCLCLLWLWVKHPQCFSPALWKSLRDWLGTKLELDLQNHVYFC